VRWDRVARTSLLVVLTIVLGLYIRQAISYLTVRSQADQQLAIVHQLATSNRALARQQQSLSQPSTIMRDARSLGMVMPGEHPYVITGLSGH
jgi:cell division protein FtsB